MGQDISIMASHCSLLTHNVQYVSSVFWK